MRRASFHAGCYDSWLWWHRVLREADQGSELRAMRDTYFGEEFNPSRRFSRRSKGGRIATKPRSFASTDRERRPSWFDSSMRRRPFDFSP
jgi:hypothetical protein